MYNFDGQNRIISLDLGVIDFEVIDLYSRWKDWVILSDNAKYANSFSVVGGEPINQEGSQVISPYFFFVNGWKLRPQEADHQLTISGNLLTLDGSQPTIPTLGNFQVFIRTVLSVNSTTTTIDGVSGGGSCTWTEQEKNDVIDDVSKTLDQSTISAMNTQIFKSI